MRERSSEVDAPKSILAHPHSHRAITSSSGIAALTAGSTGATDATIQSRLDNVSLALTYAAVLRNHGVCQSNGNVLIVRSLCWKLIVNRITTAEIGVCSVADSGPPHELQQACERHARRSLYVHLRAASRLQ